MTSGETQIQIFTDWPMSHAKHVIKDIYFCRDGESTHFIIRNPNLYNPL